MPLMTINGQTIGSAETFDVINPATGELLDVAPQCSQEQLDQAVAAAQAAFPGWSRRPLEQRRELLRACAARIREHRAELVELLTLEQGKPTVTAEREVGGTAKWLEVTAELPLPGEELQLDGQRSARVTRKPYGVVAAIAPWNYPLMSIGWKIGPGLLTGNTLVAKPSPYTPLATLRLGEILLDLLPAGVLNIVSGTDALGAQMTHHPGVRKVSFTGSTATGRKIFAAASADFKGLTLEMGGNDPAIVLADADPVDTARKIYAAAFENAGQICAAIKRVYVHESIHDALVEELVRLADAAVVGSGLDPATTIGPISNKPQFERVLELMRSAASEGGQFVAGTPNPLDRPGYFIAPAIVTGLADNARLVAEEQFGPVLPVLKFSDVDDALARANGTPYGLSASVWSQDAGQAAEIAAQIDAGTVWVNQHMKILPQLPTVGVKSSGVGAENGPWGLESFLQIQTVLVAA